VHQKGAPKPKILAAEKAAMPCPHTHTAKKTEKPKSRVSRVPSHIFKRNDFYYFRVALPKAHKERLGNEVFMSLRTTIRAKALRIAQHLYPYFLNLVDNPDMGINELKRRLNEHLQVKLEEDSINMEPSFPRQSTQALKTNTQRPHIPKLAI
jgi:hypothetical protein